MPQIGQVMDGWSAVQNAPLIALAYIQAFIRNSQGSVKELVLQQPKSMKTPKSGIY
jgi:hypothetical protein